MISQSLSRRQFITCSGGATASAVALLMLRDAGAVTGPGHEIAVPDGAVEVNLQWDEGPENATGFLFEWGEDGVTFPNVVTIEGRQTGGVVVFPGSGTYYGRLKAYNEAGASPPGSILIIPVKP